MTGGGGIRKSNNERKKTLADLSRGGPYLTKDLTQNGLGVAVPPPNYPPLPSLSNDSNNVRRLPNVIFQVFVSRALVRQPS